MPTAFHRPVADNLRGFRLANVTELHMQSDIRYLIETLAADILVEEVRASEAAGLAAQAQENANAGFAAAVSSLSRQHRIKALELRGHLAILAKEYPDALSHED